MFIIATVNMFGSDFPNFYFNASAPEEIASKDEATRFNTRDEAIAAINAIDCSDWMNPLKIAAIVEVSE